MAAFLILPASRFAKRINRSTMKLSPANKTIEFPKVKLEIVACIVPGGTSTNTVQPPVGILFAAKIVSVLVTGSFSHRVTDFCSASNGVKIGPHSVAPTSLVCKPEKSVNDFPFWSCGDTAQINLPPRETKNTLFPESFDCDCKTA